MRFGTDRLHSGNEGSHLMRLELVAFAVAATAVTLTAADVKFTSTWKSPEGQPPRFSGKKVVALVISDDVNLRVSSEEALARELTALGVVGTPAYRLIPKEELTNADKARGWFERAKAEGAVAMRLVDAKTVQSYTPATFSSVPYGTLWGYYGYGWGSIYTPGSVDENTYVSIEPLIFRVPQNLLLRPGVSERKDPK